MNDTEKLLDKIEYLEKQIEFLMQKRMSQVDFLPGSVKQRTIGEGPLWINSGLSADKPTTPLATSLGSYIYFATDTNVLWVHNGTAYKSVTLT